MLNDIYLGKMKITYWIS